MDALEALIAAKRKDIVDVEAKIASHETAITRLRDGLKIAQVELAAFEKAAELRPSGRIGGDSDEVGPDASSNKKRGRQPGSISFAWRKALGTLHTLGDRFDYEMMLIAARHHGITTSLSSIRDRARLYVEHKLLEGSSEEGFLVTKNAIDKFGLDRVPAESFSVPHVNEEHEEEEDEGEEFGKASRDPEIDALIGTVPPAPAPEHNSSDDN
ncbi:MULTISPECIES: hypothetical protein [Methylobacterium]|uniref:hypothetical protein n=1 Tax=Methylobacterium TaxID=407 RepID=UPI00272E36E2|nr:hypothetical protein [Methylobacterium sp.]